MDDGMGMGMGDMGFNPDSVFPSDSFNPFSILGSMQIGSSSITNVDWSEPQIVTMSLVGGRNIGQDVGQPHSNNTSAADFLIVSVVPYTGVEG